ncbi:MAG: N5-glutamine methyltransferase family protein [Candidatus Dormibacteria bacterium]
MTPRLRTSPHRDAQAAAQLLDDATDQIRASPAIDHWRPQLAREDAEELLAIAVRRDDINDIDVDLRLTPAAGRRFADAVRRRVSGEPVALIRGHVVFAGLELAVQPGVFIPRGSSELLSESGVAALRRQRRPIAVDLACGAGPVACAMASALPRAEVWGLDVAPDAVALARRNARRNHLANVRFRVSNLLDELPTELLGRISVVTIHPPYVGSSEVRSLPREIRRFEPRHTLSDGSRDGLDLVRALAAAAPQFLTRGGHVIVEIAPYLSRTVQAILRRAAYEVRWTSDSDGVTRVVIGRHAG